MRLAQEQIPQPKFLRLGLQLFDDRNDRLPSVLALRELVVSDFLRGDDFFLEIISTPWVHEPLCARSAGIVPRQTRLASRVFLSHMARTCPRSVSQSNMV